MFNSFFFLLRPVGLETFLWVPLGGKCFMSLASKCKVEFVYSVKEIMNTGDEGNCFP